MSIVGQIQTMELKPRKCAYNKCGKSFKPKVHNAKYHSAECRRLATNEKILKKYHDDKAKRKRKRVCKTKGCTTVLSRYNLDSICESCKTNRLIDRLVGWGWNKDKLKNEWKY